MKVKESTYDVGVIIGRFQVPELHQGHIDLIQTVCKRHDKVIIFLGLSPLKVTRENPLDFESRKQLLLEKFPSVIVMYQKDQFSDDVWSKQVDEKIRDVTTPTQSVVLYGSRDSFISHYTGKFKTQELESESYQSGKEVRKAISRVVKATPDFRAGVVWASHSQFPTVYTCVDIAILNEDSTKILLGRKPLEDKYRLVGGFADVTDETFEAAARRETFEETGLEVSDPRYIGSFSIDDWRYRKEVDKIKTLLFVAKRVYGTPRANDDIAEVRWFEFGKLSTQLSCTHLIMPNHVKLIEAVLEFTDKEKNYGQLNSSNR